jgi:microcystin-dependent protein
VRPNLATAAIAVLTAASAALCFAGAASAQSQPFLGQLMLTGANFCPMGWEQASGQLLPISQNVALFQLLGTTYGGDGRSTFALPKLAAPQAGLTWCIAVRGVFPSRQ